MHQLGMGTTGLESHFGPVRNPWNSAYIPGGSSSGSAAAAKTHDFHGDLSHERRLRIGIADNFKADEQVTAAFTTAVETMRRFDHDLVTAKAPFEMPPFGDMHAIEVDRKTVSDRVFERIDVLLLPTTATTVPTVTDAHAHRQALSADNTLFANYFGLPAHQYQIGVESGRKRPIP